MFGIKKINECNLFIRDDINNNYYNVNNNYYIHTNIIYRHT